MQNARHRHRGTVLCLIHIHVPVVELCVMAYNETSYVRKSYDLHGTLAGLIPSACKCKSKSDNKCVKRIV